LEKIIKQLKKPELKFKNVLDKNDYEDINNLQKLCIAADKIALKLELDYKLHRSETKIQDTSNINEFMYYDENKLIGYIGICHYGGEAIEVNGMVHPDYRSRGIFKLLFSFVKDEWYKREASKMLLLSDNNSTSGLAFIKSTGASYAQSEYEMFLRNIALQNSKSKEVVLRKATNNDGKEIAWQNSIYSNIEFKEENIPMPEEEEKFGTVNCLAEIDNKIIGKVQLEINDEAGGIYGLGVLPEYRSKGYGRQILSLAIEKLKETNCKDIMLQVAVKNKNALNLYKSCGFEETSTMDYYEISK